MRLIADIETDGFLDAMTRIHCITLHDVDSEQKWMGVHPDAYDSIQHPNKITLDEAILNLLTAAEEIVFHNGIKFDIPAIQKIYPQFKPLGVVRDTIVLTRLIWPEIKQRDLKQIKLGKFPGKLAGKQSLEAWGQRMGNYKGDFKGPWDVCTQEMVDYCDQDGAVTKALYLRILSKKYSDEAIELEHAVAWIVARQERYGFQFNIDKAGKLHADLVSKKLETEKKLKEFFKPWEVRTPFTPKRDNKKKGWKKGVTVEKVKVIYFKPSSRDHIANRLKVLYGWKPEQFTDGGKPKVDEKILSKLDYEPAPLLTEFLTLEKRLGQLAEGDQAWLKSVQADGRIRGAVITNGAVTGRMTHSKPNVAQVPKVGSLYGAECRELFEVPKGKTQVGADAAGLELRCLGHYMAKYDEGAYSKAVVEGKQDDGTDVHSLNTVAIGLEPKTVYVISGKQVKGRDCAKTFIYAFLYGAGDEKIGKITGKGKSEGAKLKASFLKKTPALKKLIDAIREAVRQRGYLKGLDGRLLHIRSAHAALNTLLQSAGAIVMKKALVILDASLQAHGYVPGSDYEFVANVHDEWQIETKPERAENVGKLAVEAIRKAGEHFKFRCPLDGEFKVGTNWRETH